MNSYVKQPTVTELTHEEFMAICKGKYSLFGHQNKEHHSVDDLRRIYKCFTYLKENQNFYNVIKLNWNDTDFIFFTLRPEVFPDNDVKLEFIKIIKYLMKLDFRFHKEEVLDLKSFFKDYNPVSRDVLGFIQIFTL